MADVPLMGEKARYITYCVQELSRLKGDPQKNRARLNELVSTANALLIPRSWVGVDEEGLLHVTYTRVKGERGKPDAPTNSPILNTYRNGPSILMFSADRAWSYDQIAGTYTCIKSRDGEIGHVYPSRIKPL